MLGRDGQPDGAGAGGDSAAHAHEYRHVGHADDGLGDHRLGREGIDGDDGVRVDVLDDATSVEKARDLMRRPKIRMPLHSLTQAGMVRE